MTLTFCKMMVRVFILDVMNLRHVTMILLQDVMMEVVCILMNAAFAVVRELWAVRMRLHATMTYLQNVMMAVVSISTNAEYVVVWGLWAVQPWGHVIMTTAQPVTTLHANTLLVRVANMNLLAIMMQKLRLQTMLRVSLAHVLAAPIFQLAITIRL
jgi:hypothetical protein